MKRNKMRLLTTYNRRSRSEFAEGSELTTARRAFTLIEILVVVAIIGVLATIVIINLVSAEAKSRDTKRIADLREIKTALGLYKINEGEYPPTDGYIETKELNSPGCTSGCTNESLADTLLAKNYLRSIPQDPLAPDTTYAGYLYYRYDVPSLFTAAPTSPDASRFGLFASLERPSATETATKNGAYEQKILSDGDGRNEHIFNSWTTSPGRVFNYAMTN